MTKKGMIKVNPSQIYIAVTIIVLAFIFVLLFFVKGRVKDKSLSPMASLAFGCIIAAIVFGENRLLGYSLIGAGVLLSVIDIFIRKTKR
jgi:hypothetical protein